MNDNPNLRKNGGEGSKVGNFLRALKGKVLPTVLDAVGVGDFAKAIGIVSESPNNAGLSQEQANAFFKLIEIDIQDRANARSLQSDALKQNDIFSKRFIYYLAIAVVLFVFAVVFLLFSVDIPKENKTIVDMVLGIVIGGFTSIIAFFYGSSQGSKDKASQIQDMKYGRK